MLFNDLLNEYNKIFAINFNELKINTSSINIRELNSEIYAKIIFAYYIIEYLGYDIDIFKKQKIFIEYESADFKINEGILNEFIDLIQPYKNNFEFKSKLNYLYQKINNSNVEYYAFWNTLYWKILLFFRKIDSNIPNLKKYINFKELNILENPFDILQNYEHTAFDIGDNEDLKLYYNIYSKNNKIFIYDDNRTRQQYLYDGNILENIVQRDRFKNCNVYTILNLQPNHYYNYKFEITYSGDLMKKSSNYIILLSNIFTVNNGQRILSTDNYNLYKFKYNELPVIENKLLFENKKVDHKNIINDNDIIVDISLNYNKLDFSNFKSILPITKKYIPLYLLNDKLNCRIDNSYIKGSYRIKEKYIRKDNNIFIRKNIVHPRINYLNKSGEGYF